MPDTASMAAKHTGELLDMESLMTTEHAVARFDGLEQKVRQL
jgi:hypothetical protein